MNYRNIVLAALCCSLIPVATFAQVPAFLPVQGMLTDDQDRPLSGDTELSFALYEQPSAGTAFFESKKVINLVGGTFSVHLGDVEALDFSMFPASGSVYIGLKVDGGEELSPRMQIGTVPFAARALSCAEAQTLQGAAAADFATVDHAHDYSSLNGVPTTFPTEAHGHGWSELSGVPATFPAAAHGHNWSELTNLPSDLADGDADTLATLACAAGQILGFSAVTGWRCATPTDPVAAVAAGDSYVQNTGDSIQGDLTVSAAGANATRAPLSVSSGSNVLRLDSNDIDTTGTRLRLNNFSGAEIHMDGPLVANQPVTINAAMSVRPYLDSVAAAATPTLEVESRKFVVHNAGPPSGSSWHRDVNLARVNAYCGDIDGCTIVLIEAGFNANDLTRRRSSGPHILMTNAATQRWSVDSSANGTWGGSTTSRPITIGECSFRVDQGIFTFTVSKNIADTSGRRRVCTMVFRD